METLNSGNESLSKAGFIPIFYSCLTRLIIGTRLITIYDCRVTLDWSGTASDGTEVSGSLTIPEVSHENSVDGLSEYVVGQFRYSQEA